MSAEVLFLFLWIAILLEPIGTSRVPGGGCKWQNSHLGVDEIQGGRNSASALIAQLHFFKKSKPLGGWEFHRQAGSPPKNGVGGGG